MNAINAVLLGNLNTILKTCESYNERLACLKIEVDRSITRAEWKATEKTKMSKFRMSKVQFLALLFVVASSLIVSVNSAQSQSQNQILILFDKPCRALDTRTFSDPIAANEVRVFQLDPLQSAPFHGGVANCGVPTTATSVKLIVTGSPRLANGGYFRVFNASESVIGTFSSVQLQTQGSWSAVQLDIPLDGNIWVAIHSTVSAHALVDVVGYYE